MINFDILIIKFSEQLSPANLTGGAEAAEATGLALRIPDKTKSGPVIAFGEFLVDLLQHLPPPAVNSTHNSATTAR